MACIARGLDHVDGRAIPERRVAQSVHSHPRPSNFSAQGGYSLLYSTALWLSYCFFPPAMTRLAHLTVNSEFSVPVIGYFCTSNFAGNRAFCS
jgi:hypothetical protein